MSQDRLYSILKRIEKPNRYLGNEVNVIKKDFDKAKVRVALVFPDAYEIGMSHVGLKILYEILNQMPDVVAERCFAPAPDLEKELRQEKLPLFSLESKRALSEFDIVGFSLTYELTYTNMINILDLGGIPIWQKDRKDSDPLIIAGGGCTMNAEPVADFLDAACLGDGEEIIGDIVQEVKEWKKALDQGPKRYHLLNSLSTIEGVYIPSLFHPEYAEDGRLLKMNPLKEGYEKINKRTLKEIDSAIYPTSLLVPSIKLVHDRIGIEIQRGCNRACRFCQAGYIDRPVRQRSPETVLKIADESYQKTGINEISLLSLSAADYACLVPLLSEMNQRYADKSVSLSVPATRTEKMTPQLLEQIKKVRKTGFTIAPEAGSERMRRVINKGNKVDDLYQAVRNAFSQGWQLLKMYYMIGLPFENEEDVKGISKEGMECIQIARGYTPRAELHLSVSSFVPKPHTPFQWEPQMTLEETHTKHMLVRQHITNKRVIFKHHNAEMSYLEGIFSRGDRRVSALIYLAFKEGCRFDEWQEHFDFNKWQEAIQKWGLDPAFYLHRERKPDEVLPWDHLFAQMDKKFLWEEYEKAKTEAFTEDCSVARCSDCGVCDFKVVKNRVYVVGDQPVMVKKGNREWYGWSEKPSLIFPSPSRGEGQGEGEKPSIIKLRARFSKTGNARFTGHLELMGLLKRALTRIQAPVCYSQGFHPQMKISMGPPLPLGIESEWEYLDLELNRFVPPENLKNDLNKALPHGIRILTLEIVDRTSPSLYSSVHSMAYEASFEEKGQFWPLTFRESLLRFGELPEFWWTRNNKRGIKKFNLKETVQVNLDSFPEIFSFKTQINPEGSVNPQEVLTALFGLQESELSQIRLKKIGVNWKKPHAEEKLA